MAGHIGRRREQPDGGVMKFLGDLSLRARLPAAPSWPWLSMAVLLVFAFVSTRVAIVPVTLPQDFILNSPFIITTVTVFSCQIWLLIAPAVAGEAAARDVHTGMHPLMYTSPVSKAEYLGGRFLAAFVLNALILLAVQMGSLLAAYAPGVNPEIIGPFRPAAYLAAYVLHCADQRVHRDDGAVLGGAADRPAHGELRRQHGPLLSLLPGDRVPVFLADSAGSAHC